MLRQGAERGSRRLFAGRRSVLGPYQPNLDGQGLANFVPDGMDQLQRQVAKEARRVRRHDHLVWGSLEHAQLVEASQWR